jgi:hypothetical protein
MLAPAADENLNNDIIRGLLRRRPDLNIIRVQDAGLSGASDPEVLAWAAQEGRILQTHDVSTLTRHAYDRVQAGLRMPGVFEIGWDILIGVATEDTLLLATAAKVNGRARSATYLCDDPKPTDRVEFMKSQGTLGLNPPNPDPSPPCR